MNDSQRTKLREHVICALDVASQDEALVLVDRVGERLTKYKVGSRLFTRCGPALVEALDERGVEVFLDLKFHDIPNTVAGAVESASAYDCVFMMTIHAGGGAQMVRRAVEAAKQRSEPAQIVAVTALTHLAEDELVRLGVEFGIDRWAERLGRVALGAGADGLVCSALEAAHMRASFGSDPVLVTPGIRPEHLLVAGDDQTRVMTPQEALDAGSDYLVIGRPIYQADDPVAAVEAIGRSL
jgi:orotidine-5'-phosphate decarboxylase